MNLRWTEDDLKRIKGRMPQAVVLPPPLVTVKGASTGLERFRALGRMPKAQMNKTEAEYAERLDAMKLRKEIIDYSFHAIRIRLADNTYYEPDFVVLHSDMTLALHETKGEFRTQSGQTKIKLAAEVLPFFRMIRAIKLSKKNGGGWKLDEF